MRDQGFKDQLRIDPIMSEESGFEDQLRVCSVMSGRGGG